ncbi:initiator RepB protein [Hymenobacter roseosalivarius DSM 11622]|uniref:Initiator RepB protein n=1 Tax=Hymenobacter roseosalivarius DSM 11622 TaxID=645990 RepID=A0A1W1W5C1_9BACT|nr:replication initiation protein [Hymenobacter roseosalivarius]SMC00660.1 initiator RepB protein [Hymenobacter roseosalivarius DSM 11622]
MEPILYPQARQANVLVRAPLKLTHMEARIFALALGCISDKHTELPEIRIPIKRVLATKGGSGYDQVDEACKGLMGKVVELKLKSAAGKDKRRSQKYGIISFMDLDEGTGMLAGNFAPEIKPFLLQLANQFTKVEIETLLTLKSAHAHRLYWLLTSWDDVGTWETDLDSFRNQILGDDLDTAYTIFYDFKRYVLEPAVKELHGLGWMVEYKVKKEGKKVGKLIFTIPKHIGANEGPLARVIALPTSTQGKRPSKVAQPQLDLPSEHPTLQQRITGRLAKLMVTETQIRTILEYLGDDETQMARLLKITHPVLTSHETKSKVYDNLGGHTVNLLKSEFRGLFAKL